MTSQLTRNLLAAVIVAAVAIAPVATAAPPRASLTDIENDVMCVACHEPLAVSQSPQANSERDFIRALIARGETKSQIESALVAQYGPAVLGKPPAHGFNLAIYIVPPAILIAGLITLTIALPRWRRKARLRLGRAITPRPRLDPVEAQRLDEELARFDR